MRAPHIPSLNRIDKPVPIGFRFIPCWEGKGASEVFWRTFNVKRLATHQGRRRNPTLVLVGAHNVS